MSTKLRGDIAEQAAILQALKRGWGTLKPVGDRLPYDLVFDVNGVLVKVQVKSAWFYPARGNYVVDNRRTKTNRRIMVRKRYSHADFDFALVYLADRDLFYVFPVNVFTGYASEIHLVETGKRQRKPQSAVYRDAWDLLLQWAAHEETCVRLPVKLGETFRMAIPSQASKQQLEEGVET
ncbi:MAG TPA: group I intron-associated PD-(D/E)XK endonuclease [Burkholderiales bacterium]|nr:group I intron-associated PD-(D/E)XK endonuclease [Burkholderiales bacterium]